MMGTAITEMTISELEPAIVGEQYSITKKYDGVKGICTVTLTSRDKTTVITEANRSQMPLWRAYRRALQLAYEQLTSKK
jgi:hypothetical protein